MTTFAKAAKCFGLVLCPVPLRGSKIPKDEGKKDKKVKLKSTFYRLLSPVIIKSKGEAERFLVFVLSDECSVPDTCG